jgi:hypothetical protein
MSDRPWWRDLTHEELSLIWANEKMAKGFQADVEDSLDFDRYMGRLVVYPWRENPTTQELEDYLSATAQAWHRTCGHEKPIAMMADALTLRGGEKLKHPEKKGELVGVSGVLVGSDWVQYVFTPTFVKECYASSKEGDNALCWYLSILALHLL